MRIYYFSPRACEIKEVPEPTEPINAKTLKSIQALAGLVLLLAAAMTLERI